MIRPAVVQRAARFLILLGVVVAAAMFLRRHESLTIPAADQSMDPTYPGGTKLIIEDLAPDAPLARGADVVYTVDRDGTTYARPGDEVGAKDGRLTVNGEPVGPASMPGTAMGRVREGTVLILAINPAETRYPDSRTLGFIPRERVVARIRASVH
jgi:hypothetical protein